MKPYRAIPIGGKDFFVYGWYFERAGGSYIIPITYKYHTPASFVLTFVPVIPESVGQAIGLKDKQGKEVHQGDICKVIFGEQELIYACEWYDEIGAWVFRGNGEWLMWEDVFETCEIIGTIHTHPELIKK